MDDIFMKNVVEYVSVGSVSNDEDTNRKHCKGPIILTLLAGTYPGIALKQYWLFMTLAMWIVSIACIWRVYSLSSYKTNLKLSLQMNAWIYGAWVFDLSILELMYFTIWKGFTSWFLLIYFPVIFIPVFFAVKTHKRLKRPDYNTQKNVNHAVGAVGFTTGILGFSFARIFRNVEQSTAFLVVLICFSIISAFMSLGLLSFLKLYYIKKYNISV